MDPAGGEVASHEASTTRTLCGLRHLQPGGWSPETPHCRTLQAFCGLDGYPPEGGRALGEPVHCIDTREPEDVRTRQCLRLLLALFRLAPATSRLHSTCP